MSPFDLTGAADQLVDILIKRRNLLGAIGAVGGGPALGPIAAALVASMTGATTDENAARATNRVMLLAGPCTGAGDVEPWTGTQAWNDTPLGRIVLTQRLARAGGGCSLREAASVLGVTQRAISKATAAGRLQRTASGQVDVESLLGLLATR